MPKKGGGKKGKKAAGDDGGAAHPKDDFALLGPLTKTDYRSTSIINRDVEYLRLLDFDPEGAARRLGVITRQTGLLVHPWVPAEQQVLIERGRLLQVPLKYDPIIKRYQVVGDESRTMTAEQTTSMLDKALNQVLGKAVSLDICKKRRPAKYPSTRVHTMGGTATVEELEVKSGEIGTGGRFEMHIAPTAVLDRGVSNSRRRVVFKILRMGSTPLRVGVCHSSLVPGSNWSSVTGAGGLVIGSRPKGSVWFVDSTGYSYDGGTLLGGERIDTPAMVDDFDKDVGLKEGDEVLLELQVTRSGSTLSVYRKRPYPSSFASERVKFLGGKPQTVFRRPPNDEILGATAEQIKEEDLLREQMGTQSLQSFFMVGQQFKGDMGSDMSGVHFAVQMRNSYDSVALLMDEEVHTVVGETPPKPGSEYGYKAGEEEKWGQFKSSKV